MGFRKEDSATYFIVRRQDGSEEDRYWFMLGPGTENESAPQSNERLWYVVSDMDVYGDYQSWQLIPHRLEYHQSCAISLR